MSDSLSLIADDEEPTSPFWMATFSDMMTLLLTFFVMLVAMSTVEVKKFEEALSYFTGRRGMMEQEGLMPGIMGVTGQHDVREQAEQFETIAQAVQEKGLGAAVDVDLTEQGVRVTFLDSVAFAPGSVVLDDPARGVLETVAEHGDGRGDGRGRGPHRRPPHLDGGLPVQLGALGRARGGRRPVPGRPSPTRSPPTTTSPAATASTAPGPPTTRPKAALATGASPSSSVPPTPTPRRPRSPRPMSADVAAETPKPKSKMRLLIPIAALALGGVGAVAFTQPDVFRQVTMAAAAETGAEAEPVEFGEFSEMPGIVVNPMGTDGRRYLMIKIGVEADDAETLTRLDEMSPAATDAVIGLMSALPVSRLSDISQRDSLKEGIRARFNEILGDDGPVTRVYFTQYVLQ